MSVTTEPETRLRGMVNQKCSSRHRVIQALTILGFAVPVAIYLWFLHHYTLNIVSEDQWGDVSLIGASYKGTLSLSALWAQHNENRLLFPNLIVLGLSRLAAFNVTAEQYLGAVFLLAAVALIIFAHKRRSPTRPWIAYCPVAILLLSIVQSGNTLWGFQLAWYLVLVTLAAVIFLLDKERLSSVGFVGSIALAVIGSLSSFQGLFIWVAGFILLYYRRRSRSQIALWTGAGLLTTVLYFYNFNAQAGVPTYLTAPNLPTQAVRFFFEAIGDILGIPLTSGGFGADLVLAFGCLVVALAVYTLVSSGRHRDAESGAPIGLALTVFGLLFALSTTYGRAFFGPGGASQSRYTTYDLLIVVGTYLTYLGASSPARGRSRRPSVLTRSVVGVMLGGVIIVQAPFGFVNGIRWARANQKVLIAQAVVTVEADRVPGPVLQKWLYPASATVLREDVKVLAIHGLSFFSDRQAVQHYREQATIDARNGLFSYTPPPPPAPTSIEVPHSGSILSGRAVLAASAEKSLHPQGVEFDLSGMTIGERIIGAGKHTPYGWVFFWKTSTVPNGSYELQSVLVGPAGSVTRSVPVAVTVKN